MLSVGIYYANECDKKKCTSIRINNSRDKLNFTVHWTTNSKSIRRNSVVLTPNSDFFLMKDDRQITEKYGITLLDCSWNQGGKYISEWRFKNGRKLPPLLAGNPVNYGKWEKLSSLEALAASLYILEYNSHFNELISLYNWGKTFFEINNQLLNSYALCNTKEEIKTVYHNFIEKNQHQ